MVEPAQVEIAADYGAIHLTAWREAKRRPDDVTYPQIRTRGDRRRRLAPLGQARSVHIHGRRVLHRWRW